MITRLSIGLHGRTPASTIAKVAARAEQAGFHALWLNDTPGGDSLAGLAAAAHATTTLRLAAGVIPLDRRPASEILADLKACSLPTDRLTLGVASGGSTRALARVEEALAQLREGTDAELVVGALGPRMRALGARASDGLLLNWLTPEAAADAARQLRDDAAGRSPRAILYARTIVADEAREALAVESAAYASYPQYAANFARLGIDAIDTTIDGTDAARLASVAAEYLRAVDELVLRAITPTGEESDLLQFVDAVAAAV